MGAPQSLTQEHIAALWRDLESDRIERRESFVSQAPDTVREAVCAFSNDLAGHQEPGVIVIGVSDTGIPVPGFEVSDKLLRQLADIKTDGNIVPPPSLLVEKRYLVDDNGTGISQDALITVWPSDSPPVRYKGRIHVRWGPRRGLASAQDERILNERRRHHDRPFDVQPVRSANLDALSRLRFEQEYLPALVAPDVLAANGRSYEQQLAATKMILGDDLPTPTTLGLLIIGKSPADWLPGAYTQFLRIGGNDLASAVLDEESIYGTVTDQIRRPEEKLSAHNLRTVNFKDVELEQRRELYPMDALRQPVRNAFMHRSFEYTNTPVRVYWFDDRIKIHNPGGPFGSLTVENFGDPGITDYRNPNLAEAMRALGYVQRFGTGIAIARNALKDRLSFKVGAGTVTAVISSA